jgi:hypothetical protein
MPVTPYRLFRSLQKCPKKHISLKPYLYAVFQTQLFIVMKPNEAADSIILEQMLSPSKTPYVHLKFV